MSAAADQTMTKAERADLMKVVRMRARVARNDVEAIRAARLADFEAQMATRYDFGDEQWAQITREAERVVEEADALIAEKTAALGIPPEFRPGLSLGWYSRGENAVTGRRAELRKVAASRLDAMAKAAKADVDRTESELCTELIATALTTAEAQGWLERLPTVDSLMPTLQLAAIEADIGVGLSDD